MCVTHAPSSTLAQPTVAAATEKYHNKSPESSHHSSMGGSHEVKDYSSILDYFFLDPLFIIGVLVLFVVSQNLS